MSVYIHTKDLKGTLAVKKAGSAMLSTHASQQNGTYKKKVSREFGLSDVREDPRNRACPRLDTT